MHEQQQFYERKLACEIDSWDLHVALEAGENVTVVDARSTDAFAAEHIPGAINIPHREMSADTAATVERDSLVVTYCDGIGCNGSTRGALAMLKLGFRVKELIGGIDWWKRDGHPTHANPTSVASCGCG